MMNPQKLKVTAVGDREIHVLREFNAPQDLVFRALTTPEMLKDWFGGPDGWELVVCEMDARAGGLYRYVWKNAKGGEMGVGGEFREFIAPRKYVATERFDQSWYPGEALTTLELTSKTNSTLLTLRIQYESSEARDMVLRSPMKEGMAIGYDRLERSLSKAITHA